MVGPANNAAPGPALPTPGNGPPNSLLTRPPAPPGNPNLQPSGMDQWGDKFGFEDNEDDEPPVRRIPDQPSLSAGSHGSRLEMKRRMVSFIAANKRFDLMKLVPEEFRKMPAILRSEIAVHYRPFERLTTTLEISEE